MASLTNLDPATLKRRSFIYRKLAAAGAEFAEVNGGAVADALSGARPSSKRPSHGAWPSPIFRSCRMAASRAAARWNG